MAKDERTVPLVSILEEAQKAVKDRRERYGDSTVHHAITAALWTAAIQGRVQFTPADVAIFQILDKIARQRNDPTFRDSYVDIAGYADCAAKNAGVK